MNVSDADVVSIVTTASSAAVVTAVVKAVVTGAAFTTVASAYNQDGADENDDAETR